MGEGIGGRIKLIRKDYRLTQEQFAEQLGVERAHVSNIETGKAQPSKTLQLLICELYRVNRDWLVSGSGKMVRESRGLTVSNPIDEDLLLDVLRIVEKVQEFKAVELSMEKKTQLIAFVYGFFERDYVPEDERAELVGRFFDLIVPEGPRHDVKTD